MSIVSLRQPPGARALGCNTLAFHGEADIAKINMGPYGNTAPADLYNGSWMSAPVPSPTFYSMQDDKLTISSPGAPGLLPAPGVTYSGSLSTVSTKSTPGNFPLLANGGGWYVRSRYRSNPPQVGNFPAFWAEPIEHNMAKSDAVNGVQCWLEHDFNEGAAGARGLGEGGAMWGGLVFWKGVYPNYSKTIFKNPYTDLLHNPGEWHDYGYGWNPQGVGTFYIDGQLLSAVDISHAVSAEDLAHINTHHSYLIWNATTSPPNNPYRFQLDDFSAWVP